MSNVEDLKRRAKLYGESEEPWKAHHDEAVFCLKVEERLVYGLYLFSRISQAEHALRNAVATGGVKPETAVDTINTLWAWWLQPCDAAERAIQVCEARGFRVDQADRFRQHCEEAKARDPSELDDIVEIKEAMDEPGSFSHEEILKELGLSS